MSAERCPEKFFVKELAEMKKFFKWLLLIIIPFGWLFYILLDKKLRRFFFWKVTKFFKSLKQSHGLTNFF